MSELPVRDANAQRILGSLLEKQTTVPASYLAGGGADGRIQWCHRGPITAR